jgi:protein-disulfide isomerase
VTVPAGLARLLRHAATDARSVPPTVRRLAFQEIAIMSVPQTAKTRRERRLAERAARHDARRHPRPARRLGLGSLSALGLLGGLAVVALAILLGPRPAPPAAEAASVTVARLPSALPTQGFVLGRPDAPVTIDLYEDFQCPACQAWGRNVFPSLLSNELETGTVRIVFHDMAFLGPESMAAGRAAYAAAQQGSFWDMWATLYANQGRENSGAFSRERLIAMADKLGLDVSRFEADMDSREAEAAIEASRADARRAGVTSTPTLIVEGRAFLGIQPYPDIAAAIAAAAR